jgi:hypothetical protein
VPLRGASNVTFKHTSRIESGSVPAASARGWTITPIVVSVCPQLPPTHWRVHIGTYSPEWTDGLDRSLPRRPCRQSHVTPAPFTQPYRSHRSTDPAFSSSSPHSPMRSTILCPRRLLSRRGGGFSRSADCTTALDEHSLLHLSLNLVFEQWRALLTEIWSSCFPTLPHSWAFRVPFVGAAEQRPAMQCYLAIVCASSWASRWVVLCLGLDLSHAIAGVW